MAPNFTATQTTLFQQQQHIYIIRKPKSNTIAWIHGSNCTRNDTSRSIISSNTSIITISIGNDSHYIPMMEIACTSSGK